MLPSGAIIQLKIHQNAFAGTSPRTTLGELTALPPISEMTYTVSSGTLNSTILYHTIPYHTIQCSLDTLPGFQETASRQGRGGKERGTEEMRGMEWEGRVPPTSFTSFLQFNQQQKVNRSVWTLLTLVVSGDGKAIRPVKIFAAALTKDSSLEDRWETPPDLQ